MRAPLRRQRLIDAVQDAFPRLANPEAAIRSGDVTVGGFPLRNPASVVPRNAVIALAEPKPLRGAAKLRAAVEAFGVEVEGAIALDVGAAAGGFTTVLLERGARRVYAVDVGFGQLLGSLRQDPRVVNLERVNVANLNETLVADPIDLVTMDLSYLSVTSAALQLGGVPLAPSARLLALVKPQFELRLPEPPEDGPRLAEALNRARAGVLAAGWAIIDAGESPVRGTRGSVEFFVYAKR